MKQTASGITGSVGHVLMRLNGLAADRNRKMITSWFYDLFFAHAKKNIGTGAGF